MTSPTDPITIDPNFLGHPGGVGSFSRGHLEDHPRMK